MEWGWMEQPFEGLRQWPWLKEAQRYVRDRPPRYWLDDSGQLWWLDFVRRRRSRRPTLLLSDFGFPAADRLRVKDYGSLFGWSRHASDLWARELVEYTRDTRAAFNEGRDFPHEGPGVYELRDPETRAVYVGASMQLIRRAKSWVHGRHSMTDRMAELDVMPSGSWYFRVLERFDECDQAMLAEREKFHIAQAFEREPEWCVNAAKGGGRYGPSAAQSEARRIERARERARKDREFWEANLAVKAAARSARVCVSSWRPGGGVPPGRPEWSGRGWPYERSKSARVVFGTGDVGERDKRLLALFGLRGRSD